MTYLSGPWPPGPQVPIYSVLAPLSSHLYSKPPQPLSFLPLPLVCLLYKTQPFQPWALLVHLASWASFLVFFVLVLLVLHSWSSTLGSWSPHLLPSSSWLAICPPSSNGLVYFPSHVQSGPFQMLLAVLCLISAIQIFLTIPRSSVSG